MFTKSVTKVLWHGVGKPLYFLRMKCDPASHAGLSHTLCHGSSNFTTHPNLPLIIIVSVCSLLLLYQWWCHPENPWGKKNFGRWHYTLSYRNIRSQSNQAEKVSTAVFLVGISGQISILSCLTSSISVATRQTTSPSLLLHPPPYRLSLCQNKMNASLSLSLQSPYLWFQPSSSLLPCLFQGCVRLGS